ncbi:MAG: hypothetical protein R2786_09010 [Flavobacteriaceae bacterium]
MKKILVIFFFLTLTLRPAFYLSQLLYYELNIDYIIENYCVNKEKPELKCNGKCYLAQQLQKNNPTQETKEHNSIALLDIFYPVFFSPYSAYNFNNNHFSNLPKKLTTPYFNNYAYLLGNSLLKPPITTA